jgi:hypothetical protein
MGSSPDSSSPLNAQQWAPVGIAVDRVGNVYIADGASFRIRKVTTDGLIDTIAGKGSYLVSGDYGPAKAAGHGLVSALATDAAGVPYYVFHNLSEESG